MVKKRICSVIGCDNEATRSLSVERVEQANFKVESLRRAYLCKNHYKEFKNKTKRERRIQRYRWGI